MPDITDRIRREKPEQRQKFIIDLFCKHCGEQMQANPTAWRSKFRKMAASPFAFYRGSAILFFSDLADEQDLFHDEKTSRVWIHGDLHAENFGTYMNSEGVFVFDVNDFDESYVGPFTWDLKRLAASLSLLGYQKALSDDEIRQAIAKFTQSYVNQVNHFAKNSGDNEFALTLNNTSGKVLALLQKTRLNTRIKLLEYWTRIENYERKITRTSTVSSIDSDTYAKITKAFNNYLETIPPSKRFADYTTYKIKDIVDTQSLGIGSAGQLTYNILLEGRTQALENDILIFMKPSLAAAPSIAVTDPSIKNYFLHNAHRTVISQRALQAHADPWLGYTTINGVGHLVDEASPYKEDLNWDSINNFGEILEVLGYLGQAVAKIHCVSDDDSDKTLVPFSTEQAISDLLKGREEKFVESIVSFGEKYGAIAYEDHRLFVDAFRNRRFPGL
jgi:uncharacterized protein (DUF2252 family)